MLQREATELLTCIAVVPHLEAVLPRSVKGYLATEENIRAMALKALGRDAQAREALRRATDMNPDPPTKASIEQLSATLK
jgi:predicted RNA polymerase sigma factor